MNNVLGFVISTLQALNSGDLTAQKFCTQYRTYHHEWELLAYGSLTRLACIEVEVEDLDLAVGAALKQEVSTLAPRERVVGDIDEIMGFVPFRGADQHLLRKEHLQVLDSAKAEMDQSTKAVVEAYDKAFETRSEMLRKGRESAGFTNDSRQRRWRLGPDALGVMGLPITEGNLRWLRQEVYEARRIFEAHGLR